MNRHHRVDLSPAVLAVFLEINEASASCGHDTDAVLACDRCRKKRAAAIRRAALVDVRTYDKARKGLLRTGKERERIWRAINVYPAKYGIRLIDGGKQELIEE